jgi:hypothetical protein
MAVDLERICGVTPVGEVAAWVERLAGAALRAREAALSGDTDGGSVAESTASTQPATRGEPEAVDTAPLATMRLPPAASAAGARRRRVIIGATAVAFAAIATIAVAAPRVLRHRDQHDVPASSAWVSTSGGPVESMASSTPSPSSSSLPASASPAASTRSRRATAHLVAAEGPSDQA